MAALQEGRAYVCVGVCVMWPVGHSVRVRIVRLSIMQAMVMSYEAGLVIQGGLQPRVTAHSSTESSKQTHAKPKTQNMQHC